jgi:hypothetical protein
MLLVLKTSPVGVFSNSGKMKRKMMNYNRADRCLHNTRKRRLHEQYFGISTKIYKGLNVMRTGRQGESSRNYWMCIELQVNVIAEGKGMRNMAFLVLADIKWWFDNIIYFRSYNIVKYRFPPSWQVRWFQGIFIRRLRRCRPKCSIIHYFLCKTAFVIFWNGTKNM